ncbi:hypothetical protein GpartN1_g4041.t1 [Galdieria partita]|uniref:AB hydrolase-1 domain-containing protein n=1 Tax=Galdieria partita TaxID=83374 RepID=A0A9C7UR49_9RHOD|nr:hypothetical protein GpartN1_g4041.t1 [Galdieria partita]
MQEFSFHPGDSSNEFTHSYICCNGCKLHIVECKGLQESRPLMLLLHGFPEFWFSWKYILRYFFRKGYRAVAPDLRGYNESSKPLSIQEYRLELLSADIESLIRQLGYESCTCVGHDWGGAIAWSVAYLYPGCIRSLIIVNAPHPYKFYEAFFTFPPNWKQLLRSWYILFFQLPWLPEFFLGYNNCKNLVLAIRKTLCNSQALSPEDIEEYRKALLQPRALKSAINYYRALVRNSITSNSLRHLFLRQLNIATLVVWGVEDSALGKELTYDLDKLVSDVEVRYIPNCSHWVPIEKPQILAEFMESFLESREEAP